MATYTNAELVAQVYIGFYDRAPDPVGLQYWIGRLEAGVSIQDIGDSFAASPEASDTYPYFKFPGLLSPDDFLAQVYQNVFGRDIDDDGLAYYKARLESGESAGSVVASILGNAATNEGSPDQAFLANKVAVGLDWAATAASTSNVNIYDENGRLTAAAANSAHGVIAGVTEDPATVDAAKAATHDFFSHASFELTTGVDNLVGTSGDDVFHAPLVHGADAQVQTLTSGDSIDGGAGHDRLEAQLIGEVTTATIKNVEEISFRAFDDSEVDGRNISGAEVIENYRSIDDLEVNNLQSIVDLSIVENNDYTDTALVFANSVLAGDADEITVSFDHSEDVQDVYVGSQSSANGFETINVVVTGAADAETFVQSISSDATLATINIDNQSEDHLFVIGDTLNGVTTVDASASVGGVDVSLDDAEDVTVTGGSGDDFFDFGGGLNSKDVVDGGDGYDAVHIEGSSLAANLNVTNVEELDITVTANGTYNLNNLGAGEASIERIGVDGNGFDVLLNNVNKGVTVEVVDDTGALTINVPDAAAPGSNADVLNVDLSFDADVTSITANAIETINLDSGGLFATDDHTVGSLNANLLQVLNITGDHDLTITNQFGGTTIEKVDASSFTADLDIYVGDGRGGTLANDRSDDVGVAINGGTGDNTIDAGANNDIIVTQDGNDTISGGHGADVITTGGGQDTIVYTSYLDSSLYEAGGANDASATFLGIDHITDFQAGANGDVFDFSSMAAFLGTEADVIQSANIVASTNAGLAGALDALDVGAGGSLDFGTYSFAIVTVAGGEAAGTYLIGDTDLDGTFDSTTDIVINVTGMTGAIDGGNFVLV